MVRAADNQRDLQAQQAAYLRGRHKMRQEEIGHVLGGLSQSHVSRLLAHAERMGWLVTELRFVEAGISSAAMEQMRHLLGPRALVKALAGLADHPTVLIPRVAVFDSGSSSTAPEAMELRRLRLGRAAAGRLDELLDGASVLGVAWGRTISHLIDGFAERRRTQSADRVAFIPLCAELVDLPASEYSSSRLAARLSEIVNGPNAEQLSLAGVPAYVPRRYSEDKAKILWEYVHDSVSYRRIFATDQPLVESLDGVITSVGSTTAPVGGGTTGLLTAGDIDIERLRSLVLGDIGGALVPRPDLSPANLELMSELSRMWTGIDLHRLRRIATRAAEDPGRPGNFVLAVGRDKATVLLELIRQGLINELVIDRDLARELERLAGGQAA